MRSDLGSRLLGIVLAAVSGLAALVVVALLLVLASGGLEWRHALLAAAALAVLTVAARRYSTAQVLAVYSTCVYVVLMAPIVVVILYAFNANRVVTDWSGATFDWFGRALEDDSIRLAIGRSLGISVATTVVGCVVGCATALSLGRAPRAIRTLVETVTLLALAIPEVVIAISALLFFVNAGFELGVVTMFLGHALYGIALVTLVVRARLVTMGSTLQEASLDLGAGSFATFRQVTLLQLAPAIAAGGVLAFTFSFDDVIMSQFTSGAGNETWPLRILSALRFGVTPQLNATAAMMLVVTIGGLLTAGMLMRGGRRLRRAPAWTAGPTGEPA